MKIGEIEELVTTIGVFSTKIRTASDKEVNVPNSLIGGSTTVNSPRLVEGMSLVVHTADTIDRLQHTLATGSCYVDASGREHSRTSLRTKAFCIARLAF